MDIMSLLSLQLDQKMSSKQNMVKILRKSQNIFGYMFREIERHNYVFNISISSAKNYIPFIPPHESKLVCKQFQDLAFELFGSTEMLQKT